MNRREAFQRIGRMMSDEGTTGSVKAIECFVFFTRHEGIAARLIRRITRSKWSHTGIGFNLENGMTVYFECLLSGGFQGPKPLVKLLNWVPQNPKRAFACFFLDLSAIDSERKHMVAQTLVGRTGYSALQILAMWFWIRVGRSIGWRVSDNAQRMVCSESVARILKPEIDLRPLVPGCGMFGSPAARVNFDEVTPEDVYRALLGKFSADVTHKVFMGEQE